jgi:hypothetical protein
VETHLPLVTQVEGTTLRVRGGPALRPVRDGSFIAAQGPVHWTFALDASGTPLRATRIADDGDQHYVVEHAWTPTPAELAQFAGTWHSDEADASFTLVAENGALAITQRPDHKLALQPLYRDHFGTSEGGEVIWFTRDAKARLTLHVGISRLRDMPFTRVRS